MPETKRLLKSKPIQFISLLFMLAFVIGIIPLVSYAKDAEISIGTSQEFESFAKSVTSTNTYEGKTIILTSDIDLSELSGKLPTITSDFAGIFNGNGHRIINLSNPLFTGIAPTGIVKNLCISGNINLSNDSSGCFAKTNNGTIQNCYNAVNLTSSDFNAGGLVLFNYGTIKCCYNSGTIKTAGAGGIVYNNNGKIIDCFNKGDIKGGVYSGGIIGLSQADNASLQYCYNIGNVSSKTVGKAGFICGKLISGTILNNYSSDIIKNNDPDYSGSLKLIASGKMDSSNIIMKDSDMKTAAFVSLLNGTQTPTPWAEDTKNTNNNYPVFSETDTLLPVITIGEYNKNLTKDDITVTATTNKGTLKFTSYTFTKNGSFTFEATDAAGNTSYKTVEITNIDKTIPVVTICEYNKNPTNGDITVMATTNEGTLNFISHTFTENGSFTFEATDAAGNISFNTVKITNIDKIKPMITIGEYNKNSTNGDITVLATTNEGTLNFSSNTFTENGSFTFEATDAAGNTSYKTVEVTNIDKTDPVITIGEYNQNPTKEDITVTATTNEGTLNFISHTFKENGSFTFEATDAAGNTSYKTVEVTNIDKTDPVITIGEYNQNPTKENIIVTASTNEGTLNYSGHTFTENGSFTFEATDAAGNTSYKTVEITNIDKTKPIITIGEYDKNPTKEDIIVTASTNEGTLNYSGHTFTENGSFIFEATDAAGNTSYKTVKITNIDKTAPVITIGEYNQNPTKDDIIVMATINEGTLNFSSIIFTENGSFTFEANDVAGNKSYKTVNIKNIDKTKPIITIGEYNKNQTNGDITVTVTTNEGILNVTSYTFTENGGFTFKATDVAGNISYKTVQITNIYKTPPIITIGEYNKNPTNGDITVTASTNEGKLNFTSYTFEENGSFTFEAIDSAGNVSYKTVEITNIDKTAPVITIGGYNMSPMNENITVNATTNEGTLNFTSHTFTENGSFTFEATDAAGNTSYKTVEITNIDKFAPVITIGEYNQNLSKDDIIVIASTNEGMLNFTSHTFTENGSFTFEATDAAGNTSYKTVEITNIDKTKPIITIGEYNKNQTNGDIIVTATTNEGTLNETSHTFKENESFSFKAVDAAGNISYKSVTITNINKVVQTSTAAITNPSDSIQITDTSVALVNTINTTSKSQTKESTTESKITTTSGNIISSNSETTENTTLIETTAPAKSISYDNETTSKKSNSQAIIISAAAGVFGLGLIAAIIKFKP